MKKGFTLVELLAVIIVLGVISIITVNVVTNNIETTKKKTFEVNAIGLLEAAKEYVTKEMENNDFPEEGIEAKKLNMKNNPFVSGIVKRNEQDQIVLENVTDGTYCVNGVRSNLEIIEGSCETEDETAPILKIKELKTKRTSTQVMIKTQDNGSGISYYEYCVGEICEKVEKNDSKEIIKEVVTIDDLEIDKEYTVKVRAVNGKELEEVKEIKIKTKEIEEPTFKISSSTHATTKELIITYPSVEEGYVKEYELYRQKIETPDKKVVTGLEEKLQITETMKVVAYIEKDNQIIVSNEIEIVGIDLDPPVVNVLIPDIDSWTKNKKVTLEATDIGIGLALRPYSYDESKWEKNNILTINESFVLKVKTRDRLGNINNKFALNNSNEEYEEIKITKIDNEGPIVLYEVIEGSKVTNTNPWYSSNKVVVKVKVVDQFKNLDKNSKSHIVENGGIGVDPDSIKIIVDNKTAVVEKINDTEYKIIMTANGTYNITTTASDKLKNPSTEHKYKIQKDDVQPTISAKSISHITYKDSEKVTNYFNISSYGVAGGTTTCYYNGNVITNNNQLVLGINTVTCKMVANNGKTAEDSVVVRHKYNASTKCSGGRTVSNGNCTYHYSSDCGQCGDYCARDYDQCQSCTKKRKTTCTGSKSVPYSCKTGTKCKTCYANSVLETNCIWCGTDPVYGTCYRNESYTYECEESYTDHCCSTEKVCAEYKCNSCTKTENGYRYYQCESTGNNGTKGNLNGTMCYF